jgi:sRNA-binding protein
MNINKPMKPGYQGKRDEMRERAEQLANHPGSAKDVYPSKSAADNEHMRLYKTGGSVKKCDKANPGKVKKNKTSQIQKFAFGGAAKVRHGEATNQGLPKDFKKKPAKEFL